MSHVDYSGQGCKHLCCVGIDFSVAAVHSWLCVLFICAAERQRGRGKRESKQINVSALCLNRLLSLGGECQVGPP